MLLTEEEKKENRKITLKKYYETHRAEVHFRNNQWTEMHPEKRKEYYTKYNNEHPRPKSSRVVKTEVERKLNKSLLGKRYRENNKDSISAVKRAWRLSRPELYRIYSNKRRSLKGSNGTFTITDKDVSGMIHRQNGECFWCGKKLTDYHMDHVIPLSRGGTHSIGNLVASCPYCNRSKGNRLPIEFKVLIKHSDSYV